ncbi:SorU family sulfite dehydrogenase c-type cytochrome subunit [Undibacterium curvum]|nr:cytochrome c [Undibacterium curvum]
MKKRIVRACALLLGMTAALTTASAIAQNKDQDGGKTLEAGKKVFTQTAQPACIVCHTLRHAGASGEIGPSLDELKPDAARVEKAVRNGIGQMPAFSNLSDADIRLVAKYVSTVAGQ